MDDPQFRTDDGNAVRIWTDPVQNKFASEREGRPIFDEATYVEVISPGSQSSAPVFEVERIFHESVGAPPYRSPQYAMYEAQIVAYQSKAEVSGLTGTPLTEWPEVTRTLAASLKASGIYTVEALAALSDGNLKAVGPDGRTWRTKAQTWLEQAKDSGHATRLAAALEQAQVREDDFKRQIAELAGKVASLESAASAPPAPPEAGKAPPAPPVAPTASTAPETAVAAPGETLVAAPAAPGLQNLV